MYLYRRFSQLPGNRYPGYEEFNIFSNKLMIQFIFVLTPRTRRKIVTNYVVSGNHLTSRTNIIDIDIRVVLSVYPNN